MTPEERLRDDLERVKFCPHMDWQTNACSACRTYRLKVALEAAWAERDSQHEELLFAYDEWESWRRSAHINFQRAERAEATIREMAADALTREAQYEELERAELARDAMWEKDRAALARVRALCELVETYDHPVAWHTEILAAIEGDNQ